MPRYRLGQALAEALRFSRSYWVIISALTLGIVLVVVLWLIHRNFFEYFKFVITYVGPSITIYGAVLAWAYLSASSRLGVVDLFASEVITICRVGTAFDIGKYYVDQYYERSAITATSLSKEDYFPVYENNSRDLQLLESSVVTNLTGFYTYMKATRDSIRRLAEPKVPQSEETAETNRKGAIFNVTYTLFLAYEHGRKAINYLVEYEPTAAENKMIILITELKLYAFLIKYFDNKKDNLRHSRLGIREIDYKEEVSALCCKALKKCADKDWCTALLTVPELARRYEETFGNPPLASIPNDDIIRDMAWRALNNRVLNEHVHGSLQTLGRVLTARDDDLKATEASSTIFRFFRSSHVNDIRTIVWTATLLWVAFVIFVVLFLGVLDVINPSPD
jgi:hypothetical protein